MQSLPAWSIVDQAAQQAEEQPGDPVYVGVTSPSGHIAESARSAVLSASIAVHTSVSGHASSSETLPSVGRAISFRFGVNLRISSVVT